MTEEEQLIEWEKQEEQYEFSEAVMTMRIMWRNKNE